MCRGKSAEIFDMLNKILVLCLTETQKKIDDVRLEEGGGSWFWEILIDILGIWGATRMKIRMKE